MKSRERLPGSLQRALLKQRAFDSVEQEATLNLLRTGDQIQNQFGRLFRRYGLTFSQYNVLRILRGEGKAMSCLEIARRMVQVVPAMTGLLDRLERRGLVQRDRDVEDRRVVRITLTKEGGKLLGTLDEPVLGLHRRLLGHLSQRELRDLNRLLEKAREGVDIADS